MSEALPAVAVADRFRPLRIVSIAEATTYLILLLSAVLKRTSDFELGVTVMGPVHGLLFLAYVALILVNKADMGWSWPRSLAAMVLGSLPFGGFWVERHWIPREPS